jgi:RecA-family ATPase
VSGKFGQLRQRKGLVSHSGLIQVDIDKIANVREIKRILTNDPFSFAVIESPSGNGIKIIVKIPDDLNKHLETFYALEKYYLLNHKIKIDPSCKDVSRLMFVSHDSDLYLNPNSTPFHAAVLTKDESTFAAAITKTDVKMRFVEGRNNYVLSMASVCRIKGLTEDACVRLSIAYFAEEGFDKDEIRICISQAYKYANEVPPKVQKGDSLLLIKPAAEWMTEASKKPVPQMLFSEFWIEGEVCILFADTNLGKTILAMQIANSISKGESIPGFDLTAAKQPVLYFDFEMSDKTLQKRYSNNYENNYSFDSNLLRVEINTEFTNFEDFEHTLYNEIETAIVSHEARILIIDNITFLKTQSTETAKDALPLMKKLVDLKKKYGLSMLILAHTPKRNSSQILTTNDLAGSRQIANFADSIFAIGVSHKSDNYRYLKQLKARSTERVHDDSHVAICSIENEDNFLKFIFKEFGDEADQLKSLTEDDKAELDVKIIATKKNQPHLSCRQIANLTGTNHMRVNRVLNQYKP